MSKLIQKVKWNLDGSNSEMYMYGEADFEANKAMQEPLISTSSNGFWNPLVNV